MIETFCAALSLASLVLLVGFHVDLFFEIRSSRRWLAQHKEREAIQDKIFDALLALRDAIHRRDINAANELREEVARLRAERDALEAEQRGAA